MATLELETAALYYELRGDGPPLLLIPGAAGDAGVWGTVPDTFS